MLSHSPIVSYLDITCYWYITLSFISGICIAPLQGATQTRSQLHAAGQHD